MTNQQFGAARQGLGTTGLVILLIAAVALAALIFGLNGFGFASILTWLVTVAAVGSAALLFAKSNSSGGGPMKK